MRYELRVTAFDMLDQIHIAAGLYATPDDPELPTKRVWAKTATTRSTGRSEATEWIEEVLTTLQRAL
jgi:hypothetical protein